MRWPLLAGGALTLALTLTLTLVLALTLALTLALALALPLTLTRRAVDLGRSFHSRYQLAETHLTARRYGAARRQLRAILADEDGEVHRQRG